jgi:hypothetical protein
MLVNDPEEARRRGKTAREAALGRYGLERFLADWDEVLADLGTASTGDGQQRGARDVAASEDAASKGSGPDALSAARERNTH